MQSSFTQCFKISLQDCRRDGNFKPKVSFSHLQNSRKPTVFMWTVISINVRLFSKQWDVLITSAHIKFVANYQIMIIKNIKKEERRMIWGGSTWGGWENFKTKDKSKLLSVNVFPAKSLSLQTPFYQKQKSGVSFWLFSVRFNCSRRTKIKRSQLFSNSQKHRSWKKWH